MHESKYFDMIFLFSIRMSIKEGNSKHKFSPGIVNSIHRAVKNVTEEFIAPDLCKILSGELSPQEDICTTLISYAQRVKKS